MPPHPIESRLLLYSKLMMATIGSLLLDAGGVASLMAMQSNPPIWGTNISLIYAGGVVFVVLSLVFLWLLYKIRRQIIQSEVFHG